MSCSGTIRLTEPEGRWEAAWMASLCTSRRTRRHRPPSNLIRRHFPVFRGDQGGRSRPHMGELQAALDATPRDQLATIESEIPPIKIEETAVKRCDNFGPQITQGCAAAKRRRSFERMRLGPEIAIARRCSLERIRVCSCHQRANRPRLRGAGPRQNPSPSHSLGHELQSRSLIA